MEHCSVILIHQTVLLHKVSCLLNALSKKTKTSSECCNPVPSSLFNIYASLSIFFPTATFTFEWYFKIEQNENQEINENESIFEMVI